MNNVKIKDLEKLDNAFLKCCNAVAETYGIEGKLSILENATPGVPALVTKDGYETVNHIRFADPIENMGAVLARQIAARTLQRSGDSTSGSLIFAKAFIENFPNRGEFNKSVEKGLNIGYDEAVRQLKKVSKPTDKKTISQIAKISANSDEDLSKLIVNAFESVGAEGVIDVKKTTNTNESRLDIFKGFKLNSPYKSPFLINNQETLTWSADDVLIVVCELWMSNESVKTFIKNNRYKSDGVTLQPILLIFEKLEDVSFLMDIEKFQSRGLYNVCLVTAPEVSKFDKISTLNDIAIYTGAEVHQPTEEIVDIKAGKASSVVINHESTSIIQEEVNGETLELISTLKKQLTSTKDAEFLKQRIQRLEGISCIINIGGFTPSEVDERFDRADDSVKSVRSALKFGFIPGGGTTLAYISAKMKRQFKNEDEQKGYDLIKTVLQEPLKQISRNANRSERIEEHLEASSKRLGYGYDARKDEVTSLIKSGVIDSTFSILTAFENATSVAQKLLNISVIVVQCN